MALFQVISLCTFIPIVTATIFTSSHKIRKQAQQDNRIFSKLREYIDEYFYPPSDVALDIDHPNGAYYAIKRFSVHDSKVLGTSLNLVGEMLRLNEDSTTLADFLDLEGALAALIRLQEMYNLSSSDMIEGKYRGHIGPALACKDVYLVGRTAFMMGKNTISLEWLEKSLELRMRDPLAAANPHRNPTVVAIKSLIGRVHVRLGNLRQAEGFYLEVRQHDPGHQDVKELAEELRVLPVFDPPHKTDQQANYSRLCQTKGPYHIESSDYKAMKCRYKAALVPYYVFKEEILSLSPYVSLFYNVYTDQEQTHLRENVYDTMQRCEVHFGEGDNTSDTRTCDVAWLRDEDNPRTALLSRRVSLITGLSVQQRPGYFHKDFPQSSEDFQVVNYGLAGHYDVHFDPWDVPDASGFRIATFLIYLSSVEEGGNTVFTQAGISIAPKKGNVLFWYSFSPSFDKVDDLTVHAGCPVIVGQKWIATKWIRSHGNDYFRPCGLKPFYTQLDIEKVMAHRQRIRHQYPDVP